MIASQICRTSPARWAVARDPDNEREWSGASVLVIVLIALSFWTAVLTIFFTAKHEADLKDVRGKSNEQIGALIENYDALRDQLLATGEAPIDPPTSDEVIEEGETVPSVQGEQGVPGPIGPAPTDVQVRAAVETYLEAHPPSSGRSPTDEEVAAAVAAFCEARGGCAGPPGSPGSPGTPGEPGEDGEPGPGPSAGQVTTAVNDFCAANNGCVGPPGPAVGTFRFTYFLTTYVCSDPDGDLDYTCEAQ